MTTHPFGAAPRYRGGVFDTSALLGTIPGLIHGFTDRHGGVSEGRFASLNLGRKWGDAGSAVEENHRRVAAAAGYRPGQLRGAAQVHGRAVLRVDPTDSAREADGLWCRREDACVVSVMTADCVPVLLADRQGTVAAAIHSGWKGTVAGIVTAAVERLAEAGIEPGQLVAAIGPCIEMAAFEVGEEVAARFERAWVERARWPKPHVDLVAAVRDQLASAGVPADAIERVGGCTHQNPARWFSYRRDGAGIGQMLAFAGYPRG